MEAAASAVGLDAGVGLGVDAEVAAAASAVALVVIAVLGVGVHVGAAASAVGFQLLLDSGYMPLSTLLLLQLDSKLLMNLGQLPV